MTQTKAPVFEKIYTDYLSQVADLDLSGKSDLLGITLMKNAVEIPFFNQTYTVFPDKIENPEGRRPSHAVSVILCKYLLLCPDGPVDVPQLVTYKDFPDAVPYVTGFRNTAEKPISREFSGHLATLEAQCRKLGGTPCDMGISCDLSYVFQPLPRVKIYLSFNDQDEEFPADCSLLFEKQAARYLDMECLAIIGMLLAEYLAMKQMLA